MNAIRGAGVLCYFTIAIIILFHSTRFAAASSEIPLDKKVYQLFKAGKYREGLPFAKQHLRQVQQKHGRESKEYLYSLFNLASFYRVLRQYETAEKHYMDALGLAQKIQDYDKAGIILNNLASTFSAREQYVNAIAIYKKAIALKREKLKQPSPSLAASLNFLAGLQDRLNQNLESTEKYYLESVSLYKASGYNKEVLHVSHRLVEFYKKHNRFSDAEKHLWDMVKFLRKFKAEVLIGTYLNNIAFLRKLQGDPDEELKLKLRALAVFEKNLKPDHQLIANSLHNLWTFYLSHNRRKEAELYRRRLDRIRER